MGDAFDDMADLNPFVDPTVVSAAKSATTTVPKLKISETERRQNISHVDRQDLYRSETSAAYNEGLSSKIDEITRREEEVRRKELELQKEKMEMANQRMNAPKTPNFPPLPQWSPIKPCFYINIEEEIPPQHTYLANLLLKKLFAYCLLILINIIGIAFTLNTNIHGAAVNFVVSIIFCPILMFASFLFAFRTAYIALKTYTSFYLVFSLISYGCECIMHFFQLCGFETFSWAGFINGASLISSDHTTGGVVCILIGFLYAAMFFFTLYIIASLHAVYQISGANLTQARSELNSGIWKTGAQVIASGALPAEPRLFP